MATTPTKKQTFKSASIKSINWEFTEDEVIKILEETDEENENKNYTQRYTADNVRSLCEHENRTGPDGQSISEGRETDPTQSEYNELPISNQHRKRTTKSGR